MNHDLHACCLDEEETESEKDEPLPFQPEVKDNDENDAGSSTSETYFFCSR